MRLSLILGLLLAAPCLSMAAADDSAAQHNVLKWPRMKANDFGCYVEKTFNIKDKRFNCSLTRYVNRGDPCKNTKAYGEGPAFPNIAASRIHPLVKDVDLTWEHGDLQSVSVEFTRKLTRVDIVNIFGLPTESSYPKQYPNIMRIDIQDCSKDGNCLIIDGFEHMGGGEVECNED
jgi:hypothetical protein